MNYVWVPNANGFGGEWCYVDGNGFKASGPNSGQHISQANTNN